MPVRKIPRNYLHVTGLLPNSRSDTPTAFESLLERDFFLLLDFDPDVAFFEEQPLAVQYDDGISGVRRYTPDVLIHYREHTGKRPLLCEVKERENLRKHWHELELRFRAAFRYAKEQGWGFRIVTDREIRTQRLKNVKFLRRYRDGQVNEEEGDTVMATAMAQNHATIEGILDVLSSDKWERAQWLWVIWHLVATRRLGVDLDAPLGMSSVVDCGPQEVEPV